MKRLWSTRTIGLLALTLALAGCGDAAPVPLARYLEHVEIQAETDAQRTALAQAFDDMLRLRPEQLRAARVTGRSAIRCRSCCAITSSRPSRWPWRTTSSIRRRAMRESELLSEPSGGSCQIRGGAYAELPHSFERDRGADHQWHELLLALSKRYRHRAGARQSARGTQGLLCLVPGRRARLAAHSSTGCAHWLLHQLSRKSGGGPTCLEGYPIRVTSVAVGRAAVVVGHVRANDIYVTPTLDHTGLVVRVTPPAKPGGVPGITIRHDSSAQGKVAENDFATYFHGHGNFYR